MRFLRSLFGGSAKPKAVEPGAAATMVSTLQELGLALDFSVTEPQTACMGGLAKVNLARGYELLKAGKLDEATAL
jgi:hypothetical protein